MSSRKNNTSDLAKETSSLNAVVKGIRILKAWDTVIDVSEPPGSQALRDHSRQLKTKTPQTRQEFCDRVTPIMIHAKHLPAQFFLILEASSFSGSRDLMLPPLLVCKSRSRKRHGSHATAALLNLSRLSGGSRSKTSNTSTSDSDSCAFDCGARSDQRDQLFQTSSSDSTHSWSQVRNHAWKKPLVGTLAT